ncbi:MAG: NAD-binding protein [Acidobacteriota bacterium]|nr:NAD-binding protein [Acidobacteriota bacterium]MDH3523805.1 NAD-binding protein [Acidobacteriota bacterium]
MLRSRQRLAILVLSVPVLVAGSAVVYMFGMQVLEGAPRSFWQSVGWAAETISTTGYGADATWRHPAMVLFVAGLQFIGVFLIFLVFPIYLIPLLEERFETRLPTTVKALADHLVVYRYGPAVETLLAEVERAGVEVVVIEPDPALARKLMARGQRVLAVSLEDGALEKVHIAAARALIANGSDDEDAAVILSARQLGCRGEILALVEAPLHLPAMRLAGATAAYTPRHVLGAALAAQASRRLQSIVSGAQHLGRKLAIQEIRVGPDSPLAGQTLAAAGVGRLTGVTVLGQWIGGDLESQPTAETRIAANGILVLAGGEEAVDRFATACAGGARPSRTPVVVAGYGEVGAKVVQLLRDAGEPVVVVDRTAAGADVVGDVLDRQVLDRVEIASASAVVLALDSDSATLFASVVIRDLAPRVPIIARVNHSENIDRIHAAGADFALSISQVAGQLLARRLLGEEAIALDSQLKVLKTSADALAGQRPADLRIRERTGCSVVAVERGEELIVDLGSDFRFARGDVAFVAGSDEATRRYGEQFG